MSQAIVHDYFIAEGGAEQVAIEFADMLPAARLYTSFFDPMRFSGRIDPRRVATWPLARASPAPSSFRMLFPLYAAYFGSLRIDADLVISSSSAFAKAVRTRPDAMHIAYIHTPMRYAWDLDRYLAGSALRWPARVAARAIRPAMQTWDRRTGRRPTIVIANSEVVRRRIETVWRRSVDDVIHPPVPVHKIPLGVADDGYLLVAARLLSYRRIDLAVEACTRLRRELIVVGDGPDRARLEAMAGPSVRFLGHVDRERLVELFARSHAYLLPGVEDFGIAPVEAMAAGKPVVAYAGGGALETVVPGVTGVYAHTPTAEAFASAIAELDRHRFDPASIRSHTDRFSTAAFRQSWLAMLTRLGYGADVPAGWAAVRPSDDTRA